MMLVRSHWLRLRLFKFARNRLFLALLLTTSKASPYEMNAGAEAFVGEEGLRAAYFGDVARLEEWIRVGGGFDKMHWGNGNHEINNVLARALRNHQAEVIKLFARMGYPKESYDAADIFKLSTMDVANAKVFAGALNDFAKSYGVYALSGAIKARNHDVVTYLLDLGVDPNGYDPQRSTNTSLLAEVVARSEYGIAQELLKHGADPYKGGLMDSLIRLKSAERIRLLDRDHRYEKEAAMFEKEFAAPPDSPFPGTWAYQKEGFGSSAFDLHRDGTASLSTDVGSMPLIWKGENDTVAIYALTQNGAVAEDAIIRARLSEDRKSLRPLTTGYGNPGLQWSRWNEPKETVIGVEPEFIRFEAIRVSADVRSMLLQINQH
jgi:hypothetical protein